METGLRKDESSGEKRKKRDSQIERGEEDLPRSPRNGVYYVRRRPIQGNTRKSGDKGDLEGSFPAIRRTR